MSRYPFIHPALFALYPPLFLYSRNQGLVSVGELVIPSLVIVGAGIIFGAVATAFFRDAHRAAILLSVTLLLFFSFGHIRDVLQSFPLNRSQLLPGRFGFGLNSFLMMSLAAILVFTCFLLRKTSLPIRRLTGSANVAAIVLICFPVVTIASAKAARVIPSNEQLDPLRIEATRRPNIFYIVVDGYPDAETLQEALGYDNRDFLTRLTELGFYVATESKANYGHTDESLASSLNWAYHRTRIEDAELVRRIRKNRVAAFLKARGYRTIAFSSGFAATEFKDWDVYVGVGERGEFATLLLGTTPIPAVVRRLGIRRDLLHDSHRRRLLYVFETLPSIARLPGPFFAFAHIVSPHPPFVFGHAGAEVSADPTFGIGDQTGWAAENRPRYVAQLRFLNDKLIAILTQILKFSADAPVIVLQSDHGSAFRSLAGGPGSGALRERMSILNAYYAPPELRERLYSSVSPVNTFPIVFNSLFDANLPLQEDRSYWTDGQVTDVTELVR